jgi:hypothetical protein
LASCKIPSAAWLCRTSCNAWCRSFQIVFLAADSALALRLKCLFTL